MQQLADAVNESAFAQPLELLAHAILGLTAGLSLHVLGASPILPLQQTGVLPDNSCPPMRGSTCWHVSIATHACAEEFMFQDVPQANMGACCKDLCIATTRAEGTRRWPPAPPLKGLSAQMVR